MTLERSVSLPAEDYLGQHITDRELLRASWQLVGPVSDLSEAGDHIVREIAEAPIVLTRAESGAIHGFFNVCRHRAGPVATCDGKGAKRLRCAYHGWVYGLDGQLLKAPEMDGAEDFDLRAIRLSPIAVQEWGGMIYVRLNDGMEFQSWLDGLDIDGLELEGMRLHHRRVHPVACNWKVYVDNYLEGYHVPFIHPELNKAVTMREYHTELGSYWSLQRSPVSDAGGAYESGEARYAFLFPNIMLNVLPGRVQTNRVTPRGENACDVEFAYYYAPGHEDRAAADERFSDEIQEEDRLICERVQRGLESGAYIPGRLCPRHEAGVWHWQELYRSFTSVAR
ncbi:MAG: aromatic ring-hydroxylating dioxygenase subunit alpha [Myxococcota bacterium]